MTLNTLRKKRLLASAITAGALTFSIALANPAVAAPSQTLMYSVDGGATWSPNVSAAPGAQVLVRAWYNNDTTGNLSSTSVTTSIPAGFTLVPNSTRTCLSPATSNPALPGTEQVCSTDVGQGGAASDAAVWSGSSLTISPTNGLLGQPTTATSGVLAMGKTRYVNLHQCAYNAPGVDIITSIQPNIANTNFTAGTNLSNTPNNAISCGPGGAGYSLAPTLSSVQALDLLGKRYVNLQQCVYNASGVDIITNIQPNVADAQFATGTDTSNTADTLSCGPGGGGYALAPTLSATQPLDLLNNRYVNLHQCVYNAPGFDILTNIQPNITDAAYVGGTDASNTADSALSCGPGGGGYNFEPTLSSFQSFDTLDATRGEGFVEYTMIAPVVPATQTFTQDSTLNGPGTGTPSSSGTVTVDPALAIPLVDGFVAGTAALAGALGAAWSGYRRRIFRNIP